MSAWKDYRLDVELLSPAGTPWQADTIMGHLAWGVALRDGEANLKTFLEPFRNGSPPFVVSDGFPSGLLPAPFTLAVGAEQSASVEEAAEEKRRKKAPFITIDDFEAVRRGTSESPTPMESPWVGFQRLHALIDRTTSSTGGAGDLFTTTSEILSGAPPCLSIYVRTEEIGISFLGELFEFMSRVGFGRDKSIGNGQFRILDLTPIDLFKPFPEADAFISLSTFVPAASDPTDGFWKLNIKRGKLGEGAGSGNPFKRPLIQCVPGSTFFTDEPPAAWYGRVVDGIAPSMAEAVQICYCLPVPCLFRRRVED